MQSKLNLSNECFTMDIVQGCSGFPYAYLTAINLIKGGAINNSLIICSETYRKFISKKTILVEQYLVTELQRFFK